MSRRDPFSVAPCLSPRVISIQTNVLSDINNRAGSQRLSIFDSESDRPTLMHEERDVGLY